MNILAITALGLCVGLTGCFRTTYRNLKVPGVLAPAGNPAPQESSWRHFFLFGWIPGEMLIAADETCKSSGGVSEIRTRRTFLEGFVTQLSTPGYGVAVNIYSPWDGQVVCVNDSRSGGTLKSGE